MARFRNDDGSVLTVNDLMRAVGPFEEFDWPGYDPDVHGVIPGCTRLDAPPDPGQDGTAGEDAAGDPAKTTRKRGRAADEQDKETPA